MWGVKKTLEFIVPAWSGSAPPSHPPRLWDHLGPSDFPARLQGPSPSSLYQPQTPGPGPGLGLGSGQLVGSLKHFHEESVNGGVSDQLEEKQML